MREPAAGGASGENIVDPAHGESGPRPGVIAGIGVALLAIAALVLIEAQGLAPGAVRGVGPAAALRLVAVLLGVLGVVHLIAALRARRARPAGEVAAVRGNHAALAWVLAALGGLMLILQFGGGFILASTWLFALTARGFGQRLGVRSIGIGLVLSTAVYLFFTKALSLALPGGPLERLLN